MAFIEGVYRGNSAAAISEKPKHNILRLSKKITKINTIFCIFVGLSMMCYRLGKENKTDLGDNQLRGRIGKLLYCL